MQTNANNVDKKAQLVVKRKKQILTAARLIFAQNGYRRTKIDQIAEYLNVGKGTLYRYFKDKKRGSLSRGQEKRGDLRLKENIERVRTQEGSFKPLHEPGNLFPNEASVRKFFEEGGFKVRFLKTLKKGSGIYCYAVYAEKVGA